VEAVGGGDGVNVGNGEGLMRLGAGVCVWWGGWCCDVLGG
jgi:hypothetical protein